LLAIGASQATLFVRKFTSAEGERLEGCALRDEGGEPSGQKVQFGVAQGALDLIFLSEFNRDSPQAGYPAEVPSIEIRMEEVP